MMLSVANAGAQSHSDAVTVNIRFFPVQTIAVQTTQKSTDLMYASTEDYEQGVSVTHDDHLTVCSSGGFQITVAADGAYFTRVGGSETIPLGDVIVRAADGSYSRPHTRYTETPLSSTPSSIIESENGGKDLKYNVTYDNRIAGSAQNYIDKHVKSDGVETVYKANVTYTITTR
ncbi:MAG TPA: hypothetical protein DDX07_13475 [Porphyromonadaceae bacterium]|jgi:hypothetical protein|nr:hypothetical protein [Porphyromonadaceae bacterium]